MQETALEQTIRHSYELEMKRRAHEIAALEDKVKELEGELKKNAMSNWRKRYETAASDLQWCKAQLSNLQQQMAPADAVVAAINKNTAALNKIAKLLATMHPGNGA